MGCCCGPCVGHSAALLGYRATPFGGLPLGCCAYGDVLGLVDSNYGGCCANNNALYAYPRGLCNAHISVSHNAL